MQMTVNHHRHIPYLQLAQTSYKSAILEHDSKRILRTAVRIGLPSMALAKGDRGSRDEGIIKLILFFFRNVATISPGRDLPMEGKESKVSRSATIDAFHEQDVLALLLTISSNVGEDFNTQDMVILEVLFHLLKGVDVEKLFLDKDQLGAKNTDELKALLAKETDMHRDYARNAPTRHNRFGTMIWVKRDDARVSTVSGQDILTNSQKTLSKMDSTKKWNKPKQRAKDADQNQDRFDLPVPLTNSANEHLRLFVEEFLDSSFNPLFNHIRKAIEREADRVLEVHTQQFFYLISWFLEAERVRRRTQREAHRKNKKIALDFEADSFALIASVLNQETFVLLNRFMQDRLDMKSWREIHAASRCFTQILLIVQDMAESPLEEDQEIAENIQNRIFYEETTHDRIVNILRSYKDQGFGYLDSCTELSHVFVRMLERYSKENLDLQVRSRRRTRKKKKATAAENDDTNQHEGDASEAEDMAEAERVSKERKFDFSRFASRFMTQACIDTFVVFTKFYKDLNTEQLKRAHRFFYRVAFKQELSVLLFRIDIIAMFNQMIKGPEALDPKTPMFKEWDELVKQLIKRMIKKLEQRPELAVEMLFSKINSSIFYLEYGYEKQTTSSKPRAPAVLEVKGAMTKEEQIGVAVAVLYKDKLEAVDWVAKIVSAAAIERQSWEAEVLARQIEQGATEESEMTSKAPSIGELAILGSFDDILTLPVITHDTEERRIAMFKDNKLHLLMSLAGFERLGMDDEPGTTWIMPSTISARELHEIHAAIQKHRNNPIMHYGDEDPMSAEEMLRRKPNTRRAMYDDESEGIVSDGEEDFIFPGGGGPTNSNRKSAALEELKKSRRKRRHSLDETKVDDETREARMKARVEADLEKRRKIKSAEFVVDSDEEDEEADWMFFRKEEDRRKAHATKVLEVLRSGRVDEEQSGKSGKPKKRKSDTGPKPAAKKPKVSPFHSDSEDDSPMDEPSSLPPSRAASISSAVESDDTPLSSPHHASSQEKVLIETTGNAVSLQDTPGTKHTAIVDISWDASDDENISPSPHQASPERNEEALAFVARTVSNDGNGHSLFETAARYRQRRAVLEDSDDE